MKTKVEMYQTYFNPLPSHEGRRVIRAWQSNSCDISIHSPLTRGDYTDPNIATAGDISIHSPLTRGDSKNRQLSISPSQIHYAIFTITSSTDLKLS